MAEERRSIRIVVGFFLLRGSDCFCPSRFLSPMIDFQDGCKAPFLSRFRAIRLASLTKANEAASDESSLYEAGSILGGVRDFESWYETDVVKKKNEATESVSTIRHASFASNTLRGLEYAKVQNSSPPIKVTVPAKFVLRAPYDINLDRVGSDNWDTTLAIELIRECQRGRESHIWGYCSLLMRGMDYQKAHPCPPFTAPNALRHWTDDELAMLESSLAGRRLLQTLTKQNKIWNYKYERLQQQQQQQYEEDNSAVEGISLEQFRWAMETVHSRAFKGDFGFGSELRRLASGIALPTILLATGLRALLLGDNDGIGSADDETTLWIPYLCAALGLAPVILTMFDDSSGFTGSKIGASSSPKDAVLLPFIDSANHLRDAQSTIEYDQVNAEFTLTFGNGCLQTNKGEGHGSDGKMQAFLSYGVKGDGELLVNYGFLPGVDFSDIQANDVETLVHLQRKRLADEFIRRN